jgi:alpha-galactosidase
MENLFNVCQKPDLVYVQTEVAILQAEYQGDGWVTKNTMITTESMQNVLSVRLLESSVPVKRVQLRWNRKLSNISILGDHWERGYGDLEWRCIVPERILPWYFIAFDGNRASGCGVMTRPDAMCFWQVDSSGVSLWMDIRCGTVGVHVVSPLILCRVIEISGDENESPYKLATRLCRKMCLDPRLPKEPVIGGNNWYYAYGISSHQEIVDDARRIVELSPDGPNRPFMVIDDGWQQLHGSCYNGGPWEQGNSKFPDMAALAAEIMSNGARPGIWLRPLLTKSNVSHNLLLEPKSLFFADGGSILDPSVPEALDIVRNDFSRIQGWGYELIKHDYSTYDIFGRWGYAMKHSLTDSCWQFRDTTKTTAQIIKGLYAAMREAVRDKTLLMGCNTVSHLSAGYFEIQRTGDDTSGQQWERTRRMGINTLAFRMPQHGAFYACDADCVGLTNQIPWDLNRKWLDLLARSGTPLFISADSSAMGEEQCLAIREAFSIAAKYREAAQPLDWMQTTCPSQWRMEEGVAVYDWFDRNGTDFMES